MSNETGTHLGEESRPVSVSFLQVLYNVGIIPAREQYRDINKGVVRSGSSPRAPHGARLYALLSGVDVPIVSIHAPRTGRDALPSMEAS